VNWVLVVFILTTVTLAALLLASASAWGTAWRGSSARRCRLQGWMQRTSAPSRASGAKAGYIPALLGGEKHEAAAVGSTFRETPENAARWRRWYRFLLLEMWIVFVPRALIGILMPAQAAICVLVRQSSHARGQAGRAGCAMRATMKLGRSRRTVPGEVRGNGRNLE
jgi:hypothetical protein